MLSILLLIICSKIWAQEFVHQTAIHIPVGEHPGRLVAIDLNNDGFLDLAVPNKGSNDVSILLGNGKGGFKDGPGSPFPAGSEPRDIATGDFNGDNTIDLAITNHQTKEFTILLGNGDGGFMPAPGSPFSLNTEPHIHNIVSGDFNEDGILDLITDSWRENRLLILFGRGDGSFELPGQSIMTPGQPRTNLHAIDINNDAHLDIVTPAFNLSAVMVFLGDGNGTFESAQGSPFPVAQNPFFLTVGDVSGDRIPDIVVAHRAGNMTDSRFDAISILIGDGKGGFVQAAGSPLTLIGSPSNISLGDINGDKILDAVIAKYRTSDVAITLGGQKEFSISIESIPVGTHPGGIVSEDLDGDGIADIVTGNWDGNTVTLWLSNRNFHRTGQ